jgi:hypothetical protein
MSFVSARDFLVSDDKFPTCSAALYLKLIKSQSSLFYSRALAVFVLNSLTVFAKKTELGLPVCLHFKKRTGLN